MKNLIFIGLILSLTLISCSNEVKDNNPISSENLTEKSTLDSKYYPYLQRFELVKTDGWKFQPLSHNNLHSFGSIEIQTTEIPSDAAHLYAIISYNNINTEEAENKVLMYIGKPSESTFSIPNIVNMDIESVDLFAYFPIVDANIADPYNIFNSFHGVNVEWEETDGNIRFNLMPLTPDVEQVFIRIITEGSDVLVFGGRASEKMEIPNFLGEKVIDIEVYTYSNPIRDQK